MDIKRDIQVALGNALQEIVDEWTRLMEQKIEEIKRAIEAEHAAGEEWKPDDWQPLTDYEPEDETDG